MAERPLLHGVTKSAVAGVAGQDHLASAGGARDRGGAGVVLAGFRVGEPVRVVAELAEDPGAEDYAEAGQAQVVVSVPVPAKMFGHHLPQLLDLGVEGGDQPDLGAHDGRVGSLHRRRLSKLLRAQPLLQLGGFGIDVAAVASAQRRVICDGDSRAARTGSGARLSSSRASGAVSSSKA